MKSSLNPAKKSIKKTSKKTAVFLLVFVMLFSFLFTPLQTAKAQLITSDVTLLAQQTAKDAYDKAKSALGKLLLKAGAASFQTVVRTALNKIAYDTATYLGSGGSGQKPLFITKSWGAYLANVGDAAIGQFIETFVNNLGTTISSDCQKKYQVCAKACNSSYSASSTDVTILSQSTACLQTCKTQTTKCSATGTAANATSTTASAGVAASLTSLNVCQPSSLEAKVKIGLGLVEQKNPTVNCTASQMVQNWGDEATKVTDWKNANFLDNIKGIFNPTSNDLGIYMSARDNLVSAEAGASTVSLNSLVANKGWLSKTNAAGESVGVPGDAQTKAETTQAAQQSSLLRTTGDIVVDAANVFVNQFAITKFNDLMSKLGKTATNSSSSSVTNSESDPNISYGEGTLEEAISSIIKPDFGVKADYDIVTSLSVCSDANNPGPTDCVIDDKFAEGIKENKTVIEAINEGFINGNWQLTKDTAESTYSLRNISILRKYRILPIGWEEAINRAYADPNNIKKVTVMDLVSCFDPNDSYNQFSNDFNSKGNKDQTWCRGLVDPNWVLKAPLNYCSKEGFGSQVISEMVTPSSTVSGNYTASVYNLTRGENYCADEKTCIKEKSDGSCEVYGYCNEEKRTWNFASDGCDPVYNTCQSFTNSDSGSSVSYLKNTLNYTGCNSSSAGCRQYSVFGSYASSTSAVSWDAGKTVYLNDGATSCNSEDEACTELLRTKPTWGSNLVMDADYNNEVIGDSSSDGKSLKDWPYQISSGVTSNKLSIVDASIEPGASSDKALKLETEGGTNEIISAGIYSNADNSLLPDNFQLVAGQAYTISADVYLAEGNKATLYMGDTTADGFTQSVTGTGSWQHLTVTRDASDSYNEPAFGISAESSDGSIMMYIQNLKFEVSNYETTYNVYGSTYKVYEKLIPPYLESACYNNISGATKDYTLRSDAPAVCSNFARRCNRDEAGCEKFTGVKDGISVSGQVTASDYCWGDCVGYDVYISKENYFNSQKAENMIPDKATTCSADAAGCNEFTNLDALSAGGESKEYYSSIKQCIKPGQGTCGTFYGWEGTDSGYQLRSYSLAQLNNQPKLTSGSLNSTDCNQEIYNKKVGETGYNADCHEFYNSAGQIFYALISATITCSDDCHAYRMTEKNIANGITDVSSCYGSADPKTVNWDNTNKICYKCLNGGTWDTETSSCVYQAIPGEGKTCTAAESGCREFNGNGGNNTQVITSYDFEDGLQSWTSNNGNLTNVAIANEKDGHSLHYTAGNTIARVGVGNVVTEGKAYSIRFLAKADTAANLNIYFTDNDSSNPHEAKFSAGSVVVKGGGEWNIYQATLDNLDHTISDNETLSITADNSFYFDDFALTEITDRYYLISGSSQVPDICSYDINNVYQGEDYNLGCAQYTDRDNLTHNLRKFSKLCSSSAVGCEQLIATQNYSPYHSGIWNDTNGNGICDPSEKDCVKVDGDKAIYAVFDSSKQCNSADLGCSRLGQGASDGSSWSDVYKNNNPNLYSSILCGQSEVGCEKWTTSDGTENYFRDPGNNTCQYRDSHDPSVSGKAWYMIPVKRCDLNSNGTIDTSSEKNGAICTSDSSCSSGTCIIDNNDYPCQTSYFKTFGLGGFGNQVPVPSQQAGLCQATASGCTEYIDPASKFSINLINNPDYELTSDKADGWDNGTQSVVISPNKLYIFTVSSSTVGNEATTLTFTAGVKELSVDNTLGDTITSISVPAKQDARIMFASLSNAKVIVSGGETGKNIGLKEAIINYQLQDDIDTTSCNGAVNFDNGCILFNERSISGASGLVSMAGKFDAVNSVDKQAPASCSTSGICNANKLIKVSPNRVCSKWLDCLTYVNDPTTNARTCYAVGECSRLDDKNECANFEDAPAGTISYDTTGQNQDATGYYLLNQYHLSNMQEVGLNSDAHYDFEDSAPALSCKRVDGGECAFNKNIIKDLLVREPENAPTDYPAHGASYLKVPASYLVSPQSSNSTVSVQSGQKYYINFLVNTKNSGVAARVNIVSVSGSTETSIADQNFTSNTGWSRQIMPFTTPTSSASDKTVEIKIYLGAYPSTSDRTVYFDDINIEPVLAVGNNQYIARECRLYPTNDSLTCVNKNNNVLKDGWEGYCLEHDPNNKNVCLMWYPVDKIAAEKPLQSSAGYQGIFPLNYCTEANGNFDLVEKRKTFLIKSDSSYEHCGDTDTSELSYTVNGGLPANGWYQTNPTGSPFAICGKDYIGFLFSYSYDDASNKKPRCNVDYWCVPKGSGPNATVEMSRNGIATSTDDYINNSIAIKGGAKVSPVPVYSSENIIFPTDEDISEGTARTDDDNGDLQVQLRVDNSGGWYRYNGFDTINNEETKLADPAVRVFDYDNPPTLEEDLKLLAGSDSEKIFRLTCNSFTQTVDSNGENMAWSARIGVNSLYPTSTPPFLVEHDSSNALAYYGNFSGSSHSIAAFGRNRETTPFGAASWPDSFNLLSSEAVKLKDQFSAKNSEDVLAGRPYGCSNYLGTDKGQGCSHIGYCSLDPNVYCLYGLSSTDYVSKNTCAGGGMGTCLPLWSNYLGKSDNSLNDGLTDSQMILRTLFLKSYNSFSLSSNGSYTSGGTNLDQTLAIKHCSNNQRPKETDSAQAAYDSFCSVWPSVGNISLNNQTSPTVSSKGIYGLRFTTTIDSEQEPLKEIYIDWGDGSNQVITGQDSHPSTDNPHTFYHYYKGARKGTITIKITDNWNTYDTETLTLN
jgi:hypothetical protein